MSLRSSDRPKRSPDAREILHAMFEVAHLDGFDFDGTAHFSLRLPGWLFTAMIEFENEPVEDAEGGA